MNAHRSIMNADGSIDKSKIKVIGLSNSKFDIYETRIAAEIAVDLLNLRHIEFTRLV